MALFVEGSEPAGPVTRSPLINIWNRHLVEALELSEFCAVYPISKKHLVAMDPENPAMSGAGEGLDQYMARMLDRAPFDAAVIAWDLRPAWNASEECCRWQETIDLYRLIAERKELAAPWRARANARWKEMSRRPHPSARGTPPTLAEHEILALCMDPMFETLLCVDEPALKRALGLDGQRTRAWPSNWKAQTPQPDRNLLEPAVTAARSAKTAATRVVRGGWQTSKNEWGEYLLRALLADERSAGKVRAHALCARLQEVGPRKAPPRR